MGALDLVWPISHDVSERAGSWHEFSCLSHSYIYGVIDCKRYLQVTFYYHFQILMFENTFFKITFLLVLWEFHTILILLSSQLLPDLNTNFLPTQPASSFFLVFFFLSLSLCLCLFVSVSLSLILRDIKSSHTVEYETWPGEWSTYQKLHP